VSDGAIVKNCDGKAVGIISWIPGEQALNNIIRALKSNNNLFIALLSDMKINFSFI